MQFTVYGAVLAIALGSVLLGLDWVSAPMSPMVDTKAGLSAAAAARAAEAEHDDCNRRRLCRITPATSGRTGAASTEYFCAGESAGAVGSPGESRRADYCAGLKSERIGVVRHSGASRDGSAGRGAGAAGELQRECLHRGLSLVSRSRLHLSAERRAAQALFEVSARHARDS